MPRTKAVESNTLLKAWVSPELKGKLYLHLTSAVEGRIPLGKISEFVSERLREYFSWKTLDLSAFGKPGFFVKGPPAMVDELQRMLADYQVRVKL